MNVQRLVQNLLVMLDSTEDNYTIVKVLLEQWMCDSINNHLEEIAKEFQRTGIDQYYGYSIAEYLRSKKV